jgi:hypothetical protein
MWRRYYPSFRDSYSGNIFRHIPRLFSGPFAGRFVPAFKFRHCTFIDYTVLIIRHFLSGISTIFLILFIVPAFQDGKIPAAVAGGVPFKSRIIPRYSNL